LKVPLDKLCVMSSSPSAKAPQSNLLTYKNFKADLRFDQDDDFILVKLIGVPKIFYARNVKAAEEEFSRIVDHELIGKLSPIEEALFDKDYSGNIALRMGSSLHQDLALSAHRAGKSLNSYIEEKLQTALEREAIAPSIVFKKVPFEIANLLEDEEAASLIYEKIQVFLGKKINIFRFPEALKDFLRSFGESLEEISPYIETNKIYEFARTIVELLQDHRRAFPIDDGDRLTSTSKSKRQISNSVQPSRQDNDDDR
jgi:predicted HicB family RNase H-like nuclease